MNRENVFVIGAVLFSFFCINISAQETANMNRIVTGVETFDDPVLNLVEKVIENKNKNRIENNEYYQFNQYEKLTLFATELDTALQNKKVFDNIQFIFKYIDTTDIANHKKLTLSVRESLSEEYRRKKRNNQKSIITVVNHKGLDKKFHSELLDAFLTEAIKQVTITDNEINLLFRRFISPLSSVRAVSFYEFYIVDTLVYKGDSCVNMAFVPKNKQDPGFIGNIWISLDSTYSIRKAVLRTSQDINLNFIADINITQDFERLPDGQWAKHKETSSVEFSILKIYYGWYAQSERTYYSYLVNHEAPVAFGFNDEAVTLPDAESYPDSLWVVYRPELLKRGEQTVGELTSEFMQAPHYRTWMQLIDILLNNYAYTGKTKQDSKFDIGPIWSMISRNDVQGYRLRLGGRTTGNLNNHLFLSGFGAYGTKDKEFVYSGTVVYSFDRKRFHENEYRKNNLGIVFEYDIHTPGQRYYFTDPDNIFLSFKRGNADKMTYVRKVELWYEKEFSSGFYWKLWGKSWSESAAGSLQFQKLVDDAIVGIHDYQATEIGLMLRFAMNERYYQGRDSRLILRRDGPVFTLSHSMGIKGVFGDYSYSFTELSAQKRFWLSGYGHLDLIAKGGKLWGDVPFPLLILPNANLTYTIQPESYSMMNTLEFINDSYASLDFAYHMDGWLFNRVGCMRKYKLREVASFKCLMGWLRSDNNPDNNTDLFIFPENSYIMEKMPYMEVSVGIENIFKLFRIDYVRRLTYLENAGIDKNGVRLTVNLIF